MPRVKIDYIVSFSSEDKDNPASNLLSWEINKKKWLCKEWEPSCSVVLQLAKAVQIESVNIGVHHAALVEVLVGLSEKPNDPFEVLVPSCMFVSAADSRRGEGAERVRGFSGDQLTDKRAGRWDRVRIVCSQPYNKRVQYGLTFVHIHSSESDSSATTQKALDPKTTDLDPAAKVPDPQEKVADHPAAPGPLSRLLGLDTYSSDDDDFRPGELFAQRNTNTDAQIRQASSQAMNNISDASTKLVKTPIAKVTTHKNSGEHQTDRRRDSLLYTADDGRPNERIDRLLQNHRTEQERARKRSPDRELKDGGRTKREKIEGNRDRNDEQAKKEKAKGERNRMSNVEVQQKGNEKQSDSSSRKNDFNRNDNGAGRHATTSTGDKPQKTTNAGGKTADILAGVVFSISGYENPRRARVRDAAVGLGARYEPHALQRCTHLVCAFPNTPKLRELQRVSPGAHAVRAEWVEHAAVARRRPPEPPYAPHRTPPPAPSPPPPAPSPPPPAPSPPPPATAVTSPPTDSDADTDDEIERAVRAGAGGSGGDDDGADTEPDEPPPKCADPQHLPPLFAGSQFVVDAALPARTATLLRRYLRAYGALVLQPDEVLDDSSIDYVVTGGAGWAGAPAACRVSPRWVWRCHRKRKVCAVETRPQSGGSETT